MQWLAMDIGGANLKVADGLGYAESFGFALWREPSHLAYELRTLMARAPSCDHLAVTMTGELADCFETKREGVNFILQAIQEAADGRHTRVYTTEGTFVTPQVALQRPRSVAAANWHALARFAARFAKGAPALLIDVGSTTCDVVPLPSGEPANGELTDTQRLLRGELIYAGIERTPICSLIQEAPYRGQSCPVARELFATTRDVFLLLEDLAEDPTSRETADGKPATKAAAQARLARMICADVEDFSQQDAVVFAEAVSESLVQLVASRITQVLAAARFGPQVCVLSGHGIFVAWKALERLRIPARQVSLEREVGREVSRCAPAHAIAVLAREAVGDV
jgi:hypothetical protein